MSEVHIETFLEFKALLDEQTDSISSERASRVRELRVSGVFLIRRRKQSFLVKQRASADWQSMTIIEAVLEYHFGRHNALLQSSPRKEFRAFSELSQRDQHSHPYNRIGEMRVREAFGQSVAYAAAQTL